MLLRDYAITPDVFDVTSYTSEEVCGLHLERLREVMLTEGLVRDLRDGEWGRLFSGDARQWNRRGKELVKKLATQSRLVPYLASSVVPPVDDCAWCAEAIATHGVRQFDGGVIVTERVKAAYEREDIVARIDRLSATPWWAGRSPSVRLPRTLVAYSGHLAPVLRYANAILFIDPYLDPARRGYRDFPQLLAMAGGRAPAPRIEIHRVCWEESSDKRLLPAFQARIEAAFRQALEAVAQTAGLRVEIFLWDDFHSRHVISDLIGVLMENGFDQTSDPRAVTTWTRLGRSDRDDVWREFEPASGRHALRHRFTLG